MAVILDRSTLHRKLEREEIFSLLSLLDVVTRSIGKQLKTSIILVPQNKTFSIKDWIKNCRTNLRKHSHLEKEMNTQTER